MGTQVETRDGKAICKRTCKAGVGRCVEFFVPRERYIEVADVRVREESGGAWMTVHGWWRREVRAGNTKAVFPCGTVVDAAPAWAD
jgi:hypothetical protein